MEYDISLSLSLVLLRLNALSCSSYVNRGLTLTCSNVIETVVHNESFDGSSSKEKQPFCTFCDMIVFWIQVQLKQKNAKEKIFKFVDQVLFLQGTEYYY